MAQAAHEAPPPPTPLWVKTIVRPRPWWALPILALLLVLALLVAAALDGTLVDLFTEGAGRVFLVNSALIVYILAIAPLLNRIDAVVAASLRPVVLVSDAEYARLVAKGAYVKRWAEVAAFAAGAVLWGSMGLASVAGEPFSWTVLYGLLTTSLMFGLLGWTIYNSVATSRLTAALLRQPLRVDPLDDAPFRPVGRQSLLVALAFVGGITLSLASVRAYPASVRSIEFWLVYVPLVLAPVAIFFLNMRPTHRVLAEARDCEQRTVEHHWAAACRELVKRREAGEDIGTLAAEISALTTYSQRLQEARTWPYNTAMLRTLILSLLIPVAAELARRLLAFLSR